jgi:hypothetical protein
MDDFKVVWTDGLAREYIADRVVAERLDLLDAQIIRDQLRANNRSESDWWIVTPQDTPIWGGIAELV